jgi:hypothetical protein
VSIVMTPHTIRAASSTSIHFLCWLMFIDSFLTFTDQPSTQVYQALVSLTGP